MIWNSFFDDEKACIEQSYMIWKKVTNHYQSHVSDTDVVYSGFLLKFDIKANVLKERYFVLTKDRLYYKKVTDTESECQVH